ncbi:unnamed protein product [Coregonus sp. 'balchen']|nr:unnamed protein product [Coregonus sp. 'balchen']
MLGLGVKRSCNEAEGLTVYVPEKAEVQVQGGSYLPHLQQRQLSEMPNSLGCLTDLALDGIFEDIDTFMYDSSDLPFAWAGYLSWASEVSPWGDEGLKICSSIISVSTLQRCLTDLNDLDHIMEILVNS